MTWHKHEVLDLEHGEIRGLALPVETDGTSGEYLSKVSDDTAEGTITFNKDIILTPTTTPSGSEDGRITYSQGDLFVYDSTRTKWISLSRRNFVFSRDGQNQSSQFLKIGGVVTSVTGLKMPRNGTILRIIANSRNNSNVTYEVRKNGTPLASLVISGTQGGFNNYINVDFNANDDLKIYMNVTSGRVDYPVVWIEIAWRI